MWKWIDNFLGKPQDPTPLGIFRILFASFAILQAVLWRADWLAFFGPNGWVPWELSTALVPMLTIHIADLHRWLGFQMDQELFVTIFYWVYLTSCFGLLVGWHTRIWAIMVWFLHYVIMCSIDMYIYGVDIFLQIALFYMIFMPVHKQLSIDAMKRPSLKEPAWTVRVSMRVLQIHLCLSYFSAGHEKMLEANWWKGDVLWRSLMQPDFNQYDFSWLTAVPWLVVAASCFTMFIETFFFIAMWIPRVRIFWFAGIMALHAGIAVFLGLWLFALIMILFVTSAFGNDVWSDILKWRTAWLAKRKLSRSASLKKQNELEVVPDYI